MPPAITFLSDFGLQDDFVGTCHGVIATIAPEAHVIDLTHGIRPGHVLQGALVLANTLPYMPAGVHLAVVDPGVGSGRRPLALRDRAGRLHVGPDNGLLLPAADRFGGVDEARELADPQFSLQELGPPVDPEALVRLEIPEAAVGQNRIRATALVVDRFGNVALNLRREHLDGVDLGAGTRVELTCRGGRFFAVCARTFADAPRGALILYEDSYGSMALAVSSGSAAELLRAEEGSEILVGLGVS